MSKSLPVRALLVAAAAVFLTGAAEPETIPTDPVKLAKIVFERMVDDAGGLGSLNSYQITLAKAAAAKCADAATSIDHDVVMSEVWACTTGFIGGANWEREGK